MRPSSVTERGRGTGRAQVKGLAAGGESEGGPNRKGILVLRGRFGYNPRLA